ncbi:MAG: hypothetical protein A2289_23270 [Deltaproteobacteria bacterium RIFOXYA12_FULL_58_15]|nr:MAG: hypothetical protein A2289_23270 [Deltaproteobacteria bacterium RIFOXYA12_FULL_58_15]OGR14915.1 MAG: hypothetical protein A2341_18485 [Deltaproteobacteria bacterium RIFOXYB12_FULL_58_9]
MCAENREKKVNGRTIRLLQHDITLLEGVDAFVFYAQHDLRLGSGWGNAIMSRGGPSIQKELDALGRIETCQVVVTGAGELKAKHILHAVGPRFQEANLEAKLKKTVSEVLAQADKAGLESLAIPPMGYGFYGVPLPMTAKVMVDTIKEHLESHKDSKLKDVVICLNDKREIAPFESRLSALN